MKIKVLKAEYIITNFNLKLVDVYILDCLSEEVIEKHIENHKVLKIMDNDKNIMYLNSRNIVAYALYNEMFEIEV